MRRPAVSPFLVSIVSLGLICSFAFGQDLTNHAEGRAYRLSHPPSQSRDAYADTTGPESYTEGAFYRGELTDGLTAPSNDRDPGWMLWRNSDYETFSLTIDLEEEVWIDRVDVRWFARSSDFRPPQTAALAVSSADFPYDSFVRIGQMETVEPFDPEGEGRICTIRADDVDCRASKVQLSFDIQGYDYLQIDEVQVLGGEPGEPGLLPVEDVIIQADQGDPADAEFVGVQGADGQAVLLDDASEQYSIDIPLPAGDYTLFVHSMPTQPDTFNEMRVAADDEPLRPHAVTNTVFTWQRSHFTQSEDGTATVTLSLLEGDGIYVDAIRVQEMALGEQFQEVVEFDQETVLAEDGQATCLVVMDDEGQFEPLAEQVADVIEKRAGARPEIKPGTEITDEDFACNIIAIGDSFNNFGILKAAPSTWGRIPRADDDGNPQVYIRVDPKGHGTNVIVIGGRNAAQVEKSIAAFTPNLQGEQTLAYPYEPIPDVEFEADRDRYRELAIESSKWIRNGELRRLYSKWNDGPDELFRLLGYRYLEYFDSPETINRARETTYHEAYKIVPSLDAREHHGHFNRLERLQLTNLVFRMVKTAVTGFDWLCVRRPGDPKRHYPPDETTEILREHIPLLAQNHQTWAAYSTLQGGEYFSKYYDFPLGDKWELWARLFMKNQFKTGKPREDCSSYQDVIMSKTAYLAAAMGNWDYFQDDPLYRFLRLKYISYDNMGARLTYGDVGAYLTPIGENVLEPMARTWVNAAAGRLDINHIPPEHPYGIYIHPLEPKWYESYAHEGGWAPVPSSVPQEKTFDKLTFRNSSDADDAYMMIDGVNYGYHGHTDANSILRFTDNNRLWLAEADYHKGDAKEHNTVTILRNAVSAQPEVCAALEGSFETGKWGTTITRVPNYRGCNWDRHVLWHRASDTFIIMDEIIAAEPGTYDVTSRLRSLGETAMDGRVWSVKQQGDEMFYVHTPGSGHLSEIAVPEDTENWTNYPYAEDKTPKVLRHRVIRDMQLGDRETLFHVFYALGPAQEPVLEVRELNANVAVTRGSMDLIAGTGACEIGDIAVEARHFLLGTDSVLLIGATKVSGADLTLTSDAPFHLSASAGEQGAVIETPTETTITISGAAGGAMSAQRTFEPGRHELREGMVDLFNQLGAAHEQAWAQTSEEGVEKPARATAGFSPGETIQMPSEITVLDTADVTGDGEDDFLVGCEDGTLVALDTDGNELWRHEFDGRVNAVDGVDIDGDGKMEIAVGANDEHAHLLAADGTEIWKYHVPVYSSYGGGPGHVTAIHAADFDNDGSPDIAIGSENTHCYVLNADGELKTSNEEPWQFRYRGTVYDLNAADVNGDGHLELLAGYQQRARWILDFTVTGDMRNQYVPGSKGGSTDVGVADLQGDGVPEGIYAEGDGALRAARQAEEGEDAEMVWETYVGDDAIGAIVCGNFDDDLADEIAVASHSGFLGLVESDGVPTWVKYAGNAVTDVAAISSEGGPPILLRSSEDGSVAAYTTAGEETAWWQIGQPISRIEAIADTVAAVTANSLRLADYAP